jgi:hypothetical protein
MDKKCAGTEYVYVFKCCLLVLFFFCIIIYFVKSLINLPTTILLLLLILMMMILQISGVVLLLGVATHTVLFWRLIAWYTTLIIRLSEILCHLYVVQFFLISLFVVFDCSFSWKYCLTSTFYIYLIYSLVY